MSSHPHHSPSHARSVTSTSRFQPGRPRTEQLRDAADQLPILLECSADGAACFARTSELDCERRLLKCVLLDASVSAFSLAHVTPSRCRMPRDADSRAFTCVRLTTRTELEAHRAWSRSSLATSQGDFPAGVILALGWGYSEYSQSSQFSKTRFLIPKVGR